MGEVLAPIDLEMQLHAAFLELEITPEQKTLALELLAPLKEKDEIHRAHYEHSIRVGLLAKRIGGYLNLDQKALFFAGIFHDLGKSEIDDSLLGKTEAWTEEDYRQIQEHPVIGHKMLKGKFDFSADIIVRHHRHQEKRYPKRLPKYLHNYSAETKAEIDEYARILALADVYDALHRVNSKFGELKRLSDQEIYEQMMILNPDRVDLVRELYSAGIFINSDRLNQQAATL